MVYFSYRFNPPLHPSMQHVVPNVGLGDSADVEATLAGLYITDETMNTEAAFDADVFSKFRLGRMITSTTAPAIKSTGGNNSYKYGFRFLYNPTNIQGGLSTGNGYIVDPSSSIPAILTEGLETISFALLLNRIPDVMMQGVYPYQYHPQIKADDLRKIREYGTHWDLEYLYRVCNGTHNTTTRTHTGDIGILLPNPVELFLGPFRSRGAVAEIRATDNMFSPEMVPVLTTVTIQFNRFFSAVAPVQSSALTSMSRTASTSNTTTARPDTSPPPTVPETPLPGEGGTIDAEMLKDALNMFPGLFDGMGDLGKTILDAINKPIEYPLFNGGGEDSDEGSPGGGTSDPNTGPDPPPSVKVTWRGHQFDQRSVYMMEEAEKISKITIKPSQGSYSTSVAASGKSHAGGGAVDIGGSSLSAKQRSDLVVALRTVGFAAWLRTPAQGFSYHIHAIAVRCPDLHEVSATQVQNYLDGYNGLSGRSPDDGPRNFPGGPGVTWEKYKERVYGTGASDGAPGSASGTTFPLPAGKNVVTTGWYYSSGSKHGGWDYGGTGVGGQPVYCTQEGVVDRIGRLSDSYGFFVRIRSGNVYHYYAHMRDNSAFAAGLTVGATVVKGRKLGEVGTTGNSRGEHLHYEERLNDVQYSRTPQWARVDPGSLPANKLSKPGG